MTRDSNKYKGIGSLLPTSEVDIYSALAKVIESKAKTIEKHTSGLKQGNPTAAKIKSEKANLQKSLWRKWAVETFDKNPFYDYSEVAKYVFKIAERYNHKMVNGKLYNLSTISAAIQGTKEESKQKAASRQKI